MRASRNAKNVTKTTTKQHEPTKIVLNGEVVPTPNQNGNPKVIESDEIRNARSDNKKRTIQEVETIPDNNPN